MKNSGIQNQTPTQDDVSLIEALGDVIIATTELQSRLLRGQTTLAMLGVAPDPKLRRDLRRQAAGLDVERALAQFDKATATATDARRRYFGETTHPMLAAHPRPISTETLGVRTDSIDSQRPVRKVRLVFPKRGRSEQAVTISGAG